MANTLQATSGSNKKTTKVEYDGFPADVTVCRVCLAQDRVMEDMFKVPTSQTESISDRILYCTGVKFSQQDGLSEKICKLCLKHLNIAHKFKITCLSADELYCKLLKEQMVYIASMDENGYSPTRVDDEVKEEVLSDVDDGFRDDEKEQDSKSDTEVKPPVKKKYAKSGSPRKRKKYKFKKLYCEPCDITFKTKEELNSHNSKMHKDSTGFICEICGKIFAYRSSHYSHIKSHTAPQLGCDHCDYCTSYKADLAKHIRIHTGEKRFQCEYCSASFYTSSNLLDHRRINHSAVKTYRFACLQCGKQYYDRTKFQRHMDSHDDIKRLLDHRRINHSAVKTYRFACLQCGKQYYDRTKFQRHMDSHDDIKRHECDICHSRFTRRCYWKKHLLTRHGVEVPPMRPGRRKTNPLMLKPVLKEGQVNGSSD